MDWFTKFHIKSFRKNVQAYEIYTQAYEVLLISFTCRSQRVGYQGKTIWI